MNRQTLARLVTTTEDPDYVAGFQALAEVNLALRSDGPKTALLVRKAILELDLSNFQAARRACQDALVMDPEHAEANYYLGLACTLLACVRAGATAACASHRDRPDDSMRSLLEQARGAFEKAARANEEDPQADKGAAAVETLLSESADEAELAAALRGDDLE